MQAEMEEGLEHRGGVRMRALDSELFYMEQTADTMKEKTITRTEF